jgi:c-di-GMP-binding flagellar brake protein YcgR
VTVITPFPEADSPALARYALEDAARIGATLAELCDRRALVTLYYDDAAGFTVASVVEVDAAQGALVLECSGADAVQRAVASASGLVAVAFIEGDKIQFTVAAPEPIERAQRPALRLRLPRRVLRIQRRSAPRRQPAGGRPAVCRVPLPQRPDQFEAVPVLDISLGGLALLAPPPLYGLVTGQVLQPCLLDLPEVGQVRIGLKVRYLEAWPNAAGGRRCGCEFAGLGDGARRALKSYLDRFEAAQPTPPRQRAA